MTSATTPVLVYRALFYVARVINDITLYPSDEPVPLVVDATVLVNAALEVARPAI